MRSALALLTILPTGRRPRSVTGAEGLWAFPLVGGVIGVFWAVTATAGMAWWGPMVAAAGIIVVDAIVTGGLHLDGVADVGDVAGSRRHGSDALEIARDPRVGALGVAALTATLVLRFALLATWLSEQGPWTLVVVPVVGRVAMLYAIRRATPDEHSLVHPLATGMGTVVLPAALLVAVAGLALAGASPVRVAAALGAVLVVAEAGTRWWRHRVGDTSGDLVGALGIAGELAVLLALTAA